MAAVTSAVIAGAGLAYSAYSTERQRSDAVKQRDEQKAKQRKIESESKTRQENEESVQAANKARDKAAKRQKALAANAQGRSSTILTSPLGGASDQPGQAAGAQSGGKTLLGI